MREILFRGKTLDGGEWVYGDFCQSDITEATIHINSGRRSGLHRVIDLETVGQYTGLKDKTGVKIFEGDIIDWDATEWGCQHRELVEWDYDLLDMRKNDWKEFCTVIGNIYDNPELMGGR